MTARATARIALTLAAALCTASSVGCDDTNNPTGNPPTPTPAPTPAPSPTLAPTPSPTLAPTPSPTHTPRAPLPQHANPTCDKLAETICTLCGSSAPACPGWRDVMSDPKMRPYMSDQYCRTMLGALQQTVTHPAAQRAYCATAPKGRFGATPPVPTPPAPDVTIPATPGVPSMPAPAQSCKMLELGICGLCGSAAKACTTFSSQASNPAMDTPKARARCVATLQRMTSLTIDAARKRTFCAADLSGL